MGDPTEVLHGSSQVALRQDCARSRARFRFLRKRRFLKGLWVLLKVLLSQTSLLLTVLLQEEPTFLFSGVSASSWFHLQIKR